MFFYFGASISFAVWETIQFRCSLNLFFFFAFTGFVINVGIALVVIAAVTVCLLVLLSLNVMFWSILFLKLPYNLQLTDTLKGAQL